MIASDHITSIKSSQVVVAYRRLYVSGSLSSAKPIPHDEAQRTRAFSTGRSWIAGDPHAATRTRAGMYPDKDL